MPTKKRPRLTQPARRRQTGTAAAAGKSPAKKAGRKVRVGAKPYAT